VNLYAIAEPEFVLIDCGPRTDVARADLHRLLHEHGLDAARIQRIVLTHAHQDHYGLAAELARASGAPVYAHRDDHAAIRHDPSAAEFLAGLIAESGTPPDLAEKMRGMMFYLSGVSEGVENVRLLEELPGIPCGDAHFEFVHLPGHTPGSIGLWEPRRRILIGGDTAIEKITPNPFSAPDPAQPHGRFRSLASYWETFRHIREMNPAVIHAGHLQPISDFPAYENWSLELHRSRQRAVLAAIAGGAHTVHEIALALFPEVVPQGAFLALTEVFSHLDLLEEEGRVRCVSYGRWE
jgi:glyoxylase-like metal-dependent hydrolase (beta-lactamase superfamily II)